MFESWVWANEVVRLLAHIFLKDNDHNRKEGADTA